VTDEYGFTWGPVTVQRTAVMPQGHHVLTVNGLDIYVSPTGRSVRVFRDGKELKAVSS